MAEVGGRHERGEQRITEDGKAYVGRGRVEVLELLQGGGSRLGSAPTTFITSETGVWSRR